MLKRRKEDGAGFARSFAIDGERFACEEAAPGLHIVATPIGNLADVTLRALAVLAGVERILCEDTRVTSRMLQRYHIRTPLAPYHEHNAEKVRPRILGELAQGARLALVSDAGTPLVSDPGFKLVRGAIDQGTAVHMAPGASAVPMALALSGLPSDRFLFAGFVPASAGRRRTFLSDLAGVKATLVLFESPNRLVATLGEIAAVLGDRRVAVARELTKLHEEVLRGRARDVLAVLAQRDAIKGEVTLVVAPPAEAEAAEEVVEAALRVALETLPAGRAAAEVARRFGLSRADLYRRALALREGAKGESGDGKP
jgi:16S rRNA (cytidine1402-2'-O)-methyltransferase